jgi:PLP dependent protein
MNRLATKVVQVVSGTVNRALVESVLRFQVGLKNMETSTIRENLLRVQEQIASASVRAGRNVNEITLIGVSKTHPASAIREAFEAGLRHFGENRVQEWEGKRGEISDLAATWHLIGHLQSNKANKAANMFDCVDAVDDFALAQKLDRAREAMIGAKKLRILLEVHIGGEETKSGVSESELPALAEQVNGLAHVDLAGLMCIPPFLEDSEKVQPFFAQLRTLRDRLEGQLGKKLPVLSMGMSHDFAVAILEGATEVRVGTAIFGTRTTAH